jgi:hypothetical protein
MATNFKNWIIREGKDIFGFEYSTPESKDKSGNDPLSGNDTHPLHRIKVSEVIDEISRHNIGTKTSYNKFHNTVQWGENAGAIYMEVSPLGSFKGIVRRLTNDAQGTPIWACKIVIPFNDYLNANKPFDESLAGIVLEKIESVDQTHPDSPKTDYTHLERLAHKLAQVCRLNKPDIFLFRGIKETKVNEHYIIIFEVRGQGVEAPGGQRIEQFHIELDYSPLRGVIRCWGHDVSSPTSQHIWLPQPSEFDELFLPTQPSEEICECVAGCLSTY